MPIRGKFGESKKLQQNLSMIDSSQMMMQKETDSQNNVKSKVIKKDKKTNLLPFTAAVNADGDESDNSDDSQAVQNKAYLECLNMKPQEKMEDDDQFNGVSNSQRVKKDALWKPLLRGFRIYLRRNLQTYLDINSIYEGSGDLSLRA